jgi:hypothetical protein
MVSIGEGGFEVAVLGVKGTERLMEELGECWVEGDTLPTRNEGVVLWGTLNVMGVGSSGGLATCGSEEPGDIALCADLRSLSSIYGERFSKDSPMVSSDSPVLSSERPDRSGGCIHNHDPVPAWNSQLTSNLVP